LVTPVVADADVLFGATTRALLVYLDYAGVIRLHWSAIILDELSHALVDAGRKQSLEAAKANEHLMNESVPDAAVSVIAVHMRFAEAWDAVHSAKDMHVAACALEVFSGDYYEGQPVVTLATKNLPDYDAQRLAHRGVSVQHPDAFLVGLFQQFPGDVSAAFREMRLDLASQPEPGVMLERLAKDGQEQLAALLQAGWQQGHFEL
jgi:hypothetical protein